MRFKNRLVTVVAVAAAAGSFSEPAQAAPVPFESLTITCPGRGDEQFVSPGADFSFTPAFFGGTHDLLVPYVVSYTLTANGTTTRDTIAKKSPTPDDAITCTYDQTFNFGGTTYELAGTIVGVVQGQPSG